MDLDLSAIDLFYRVSLSARPTYPEPHTSDSRPLWQCRTSFCKCLLFEGTLQNEIENHRENSTNLQNMPTKSLPEQNGAFLKVSNPPRNISFQLCVSECSGCKHGKSICFRYLQYISKSRINTYNKTMAVSLARLLRWQIHEGSSISCRPEGRRLHFFHRVVQLWHRPDGWNLYSVRSRSGCFESSTGEAPRLHPIFSFLIIWSSPSSTLARYMECSISVRNTTSNC